MLIRFFILFFIFSTSYSFNSTIIQISKIKEVLSYLNKSNKSLVVFDIDNTLLRPITSLGSDEWFSYLVEKEKEQSKDVIKAINLVLPLYFHVNQHIDLKPIEDSLIEDIKLIEKDCNHTICLTARSLNIVNRTLDQLAKNRLTFNVPELKSQDLKFDFEYPATYKNGVIFAENNNKGNILLSFLDNIHYVPDYIIFVDDKLKNIEAVQKAAEEKNLNFIGLHYTGCDKFVKSFNQNLVNQELQQFLSKYPYNIQ